MKPFFTADSAQLTVLRTLASSSFGSYQLRLPTDVELSEVFNESAPGNEPGYVAALSDRVVGGFARRFIRSDVSVSVARPSDDDWIASTDVDRSLEAAANRVKGDFFLESDISKAGLNNWIPYADFQVGDLVNVEIWGRVVVLPVTRIEPVISDHSVTDWKVHVGGQLVADEDARLIENESVRRALIEDRRNLMGLEDFSARVTKKVEDVRNSANIADDKAESADRKAQTADNKAEQALNRLVEANRERSKLNEKLIEQNTQQDNKREELARQWRREKDALDARQDELAREIDRRAVGAITVMADRRASSRTHGIGVDMPSYDREFRLLVSPYFSGAISVDIFYSNGSVYPHQVKPSDLDTIHNWSTSSYRRNNGLSYFDDLASPSDVMQKWFLKVPVGDVRAARVLVDKVSWNYT